MLKRVILAGLLVSAMVLGCFYILRQDVHIRLGHQEAIEWLGPKEIELESERFQLNYAKGKRLLVSSPDATEVISLYGTYNNGGPEENILIEKLGDKIRFRAWWVTEMGDVWLIDGDVPKTILDQLWETLENNKVFELQNESRDMSHAMHYWLALKKDGQEHSANAYGVGWYSTTTIRGSEVSPEWEQVVSTILSSRGSIAHEIRPAGFTGSQSGVFTGKVTGEVLVDEIATKQINAIKEGVNQQELSWESVLEFGYYRNREIVEMVVELLDSPDADISAAACAAMSWATAKAPDADPEHWKNWWAENGSTYQPSASSTIEGPHGNGAIRNLGGYAKGFVKVENDDEGDVWALVETQSSWDKKSYTLYKLDRESEKFVSTTMTRSFGSKWETPPPARFFRRVCETKIDFPEYHNGVWVSSDGKWGAAILGQESIYHSDSVVVLDFTTGKMRSPLRTSHQYASPVVSSNGKFVAVAKGWNWANPNKAVVVDTVTLKEQLIPIAPADNLGPVAFVEQSAFGAGYYLYRRDNEDDSGTLWWCSPDGSRAEKLLKLPRTVSVCENATSDGGRILSWRSTDQRNGREYGWLQIADGTFEPIVPGTAWPKSFDTSSDGSSVVFIDKGKVYQWQRSDKGSSHE